MCSTCLKSRYRSSAGVRASGCSVFLKRFERGVVRWCSTPTSAHATGRTATKRGRLRRVLKLGHTLLAGVGDSALLESECTVDQLLRPLRDASLVEAVVKPEEPGAIAMSGEGEAMVPVSGAVAPVDTTAEGAASPPRRSQRTCPAPRPGRLSRPGIVLRAL
jgi:hypothetical protein